MICVLERIYFKIKLCMNFISFCSLWVFKTVLNQVTLQIPLKSHGSLLYMLLGHFTEIYCFCCNINFINYDACKKEQGLTACFWLLSWEREKERSSLWNLSCNLIPLEISVFSALYTRMLDYLGLSLIPDNLIFPSCIAETIQSLHSSQRSCRFFFFK